MISEAERGNLNNSDTNGNDITRLWQVSGRSDTDKFEDAVKLYIDYIENWSLWLDMQILLRTVNVVLQKTGAY